MKKKAKAEMYVKGKINIKARAKRLNILKVVHSSKYKEAGISDKLLTYFALVVLGLFISCARMGAVKSASDVPATSSVGTSMPGEDGHEQRMEEAEAGRNQINVNAQEKSTQRGITEPPENDIYSAGQYTPAPGYTRFNPDERTDLRLKKKDSGEYWNTDTTNAIYMDNNLLIGDEISNDTETIYSVLVQDASISIRSGENAQRLYIEELKKIDLQPSPPEFKDAFEKHVDAWERDSDDEIKSTMDEILRIALKYGVRMKR